ncbi:hypothetical protein C8Q76DRAFT_726911 [Earliella scabrosa]|nr:hypothetical protein C8Q76DRAFT_726911 [Earliella scabrosa]
MQRLLSSKFPLPPGQLGDGITYSTNIDAPVPRGGSCGSVVLSVFHSSHPPGSLLYPFSLPSRPSSTVVYGRSPR